MNHLTALPNPGFETLSLGKVLAVVVIAAAGYGTYQVYSRKVAAKAAAKALPKVECVPGELKGVFVDKHNEIWDWDVLRAETSTVYGGYVRLNRRSNTDPNVVDKNIDLPLNTSDEGVCALIVQFFKRHGLGR